MNFSRLRALAGVPSICMLLLTVTQALAAEIVVTSFEDLFDDDDGLCTLREAVRSANGDVQADPACVAGSGADRILLASGTYKLDLVNRTGEDEALDGDLDVIGSLEIRGVSPQYTIIDGIAETSAERVLTVLDNASVVLRNLTVRGGSDELGGNLLVIGPLASLQLADITVERGSSNFGGGLYVEEGSALLIRTTVANNSAVSGGGINVLGGTLQVRDSIVRSNTSTNFAGGIASSDNSTLQIVASSILDNATAISGGGVYAGSDSVEIQYSLIQGNSASRGAGLFVHSSSVTTNVLHSAFIDNAAVAFGGGIRADGDVIVRHTTFSGNSANSGGAAYSANNMSLFDSVTIAGNTGGGIFNESGALFEFSLLADNAGGNCLGDAPTASTPNLDDGDTCQFDPNAGGLNAVDPLLGPLANNGGPTPSLALLPGSPAIDAVSSEVKPNCGPPDNSMMAAEPDQRGYPRGVPQEDVSGQAVSFCDLGAFELHAPYVVDSTDDEVDEDVADGLCLTATGVCTLRAAVQQANATEGFEEIELPVGTFALTLLGADEEEAASGDLDLLDPVIIRGVGAGQTIIDGVGDDRVLDVMRPAKTIDPAQPDTHFLEDLTIQNGSVAGAGGGGGLRIESRGLRVERAVLNDNAAEGIGGAVRCESPCEMTFIDSRFTGNSSAGAGGAIGMRSDQNGPDSIAPVLIERSEFAGNAAAGFGGALSIFDLTLRNSTISDNHALDSNVGSGGGGVEALYGRIENTTIVANTGADDAGGAASSSAARRASSPAACWHRIPAVQTPSRTIACSSRRPRWAPAATTCPIRTTPTATSIGPLTCRRPTRSSAHSPTTAD